MASISDAEVRFQALKLLYSAGSYGRLQMHLIDRLPAVSAQRSANVLKALETEGLVQKTKTIRSTKIWAYMLTVTETGKAAYQRALEERHASANATTQALPALAMVG